MAHGFKAASSTYFRPIAWGVCKLFNSEGFLARKHGIRTLTALCQAQQVQLGCKVMRLVQLVKLMVR